MGTKSKNQSRKIAKNIKQEERFYYIFGLDDTYENMEDKKPNKIMRAALKFSNFFGTKIMPYVNLFSFL